MKCWGWLFFFFKVCVHGLWKKRNNLTKPFSPFTQECSPKSWSSSGGKGRDLRCELRGLNSNLALLWGKSIFVHSFIQSLLWAYQFARSKQTGLMLPWRFAWNTLLHSANTHPFKKALPSDTVTDTFPCYHPHSRRFHVFTLVSVII